MAYASFAILHFVMFPVCFHQVDDVHDGCTHSVSDADDVLGTDNILFYL
jgi:hypothetical protein